MKTSRFILGLILIAAGVLLFLEKLGYASWDIVWLLGKFWPVILILVGLSMLLGGTLPRWLGLLIATFLMTGLILVMILTPGWNQYQPARPAVEEIFVDRTEYPGVTAGELDLFFGGGELSIGSETSQWVSGSFRGSASRTVLADSNKISISLRPGKSYHNGKNNWAVNISPDLQWDIALEAGAVDGNLDLSGLLLNTVRLKVGAGDIDLMLRGNGPQANVQIDAGASDLLIQIPTDAGVRLKMSGAVNSNNVGELGWAKDNGEYTSPNYNAALEKIDLDVNMAVGNLRIEQIAVN